MLRDRGQGCRVDVFRRSLSWLGTTGGSLAMCPIAYMVVSQNKGTPI